MDDSKVQNSGGQTPQVTSQNQNVSYEHSTEALKVTMPGKDQQVVVHAIPGQKIEINGTDPSKLAINILGADVIMSDPLTNAKIVFLGLGLILFSPQEAPSIFLGDVEFMPQDILSKVGLIRNITQKDYLSFTSLSLENIHDKQEETTDEPKVQVITKIQEVIVDISPKQTFAVEVADEDFNLTSDPRPDFVSDTEGVPPAPENFHKKNNSQSASETETQTQTSVDDSTSARTSFDFEVRLLQVAQTYDSGSNTTRGGGGSGAAAFDPSATSQFSTETIDLVSNSAFQTVYADNDTYFSETQAARVLEFSPNLPDAFDVTSVVISGLPSGVSVYGATYDAGADAYTLTSLTPNARGDIEIYLVFSTDASMNGTAFTVVIDSVADYDPSSPDAGPTPPADTSLPYHLEQAFEIKAATSTADLDPTDGVFDLSTLQNENRILLGNGGSMVYGSAATDTVVGGLGDDTIRGGGDDDSLDGGGGLNDTISFNDKDSASSVVIDLTSAADGNGFRSATIGTETDSYKNFEHVIGGAGADQILGDAGDNILDGGAGDDYIMGRDGDDTLTGGLDTDTVDYSYAGNGITIALQSSGSYAQVVTGTDTDTLSGFENLIATDYNDTITGSSDNNVIDARAGTDLINSSTGNDAIDGGTGTDTINYSTFTAGITVNLLDAPDVDGYVALTATGKADRIKGIENITGTDFNDTITGDGTGQTLIGNDGDDVIDGDAGNDTIYGGYGTDTLSGGLGYDFLHFDDLAGGADSVAINITAGTAIYTGGGTPETDTFSGFEDFTGTSGDDDFVSATGSYLLNGYFGGGSDLVDYTAAGGAITVVLSATTANFGTVTKSGTWAGTDTLQWIDVIVGNSGGNDSFTAGTGTYMLLGDSGTDSLTYAGAGGAVTVNLQLSNVTKSGTWAGVDTLMSIETITGSDAYADTFTAVDGQNFTLGGGADGGAIVDSITYAGLAAITVNMNTGTVAKSGGTDTISSIENITGTSNIDYFYSGAGNYTFAGGAGTDHLNYSQATGAVTVTASGTTANSGTTTKSGTWAGTDTFSSFSVFIGSNYADTFIGGMGNMTFTGGSGSDTVTYAGADGAVDVLVSVTVTKTGTWAGTDYINDVQIYIGSDAYADTFTALEANNFTLNGGAGAGINDSITYAGFANAVTVSLAAGTVTKSSGTDTILSIENITGTGQNDSFTAGNGSYILNAGAGTDSLSYVPAGGAVTINLQTGSVVKSGTWSGTDTVSNFETITGSDSYADSFIATTTGNYTLNGGADGGAIIDNITYAGLAAITVDLNSTITVIKASGTDLLTSIESVTATSNDDTFTANNGTFTLDGGAGNDSLNYAAAGGAVSINMATGFVTKSGTWSGTDTISNFETIYGSDNYNDTFTGALTGNYTLYGDSNTSVYDSLTYGSLSASVSVDISAGTVLKNSGANRDFFYYIEDIAGSTGDDTFTAGNGTYTLRGDAGTDTITYSGAGGAITFDLNLGGYATATKSGTWSGTDTLTSFETIIGSTYNDSFVATSGTYTLNGSGGSDTVTYTGAGGAVSVNLTAGTVTKSGTWSGTDTITSIETIYGSIFADTFTAGTGSYDLRGNAGNDTLTYVNAGGSLTWDMVNRTVVKSGTWSGTDSYTNMEIYVGGSSNDAFTAADGSSTIDGGAGTDSITYGAAGGALTINVSTGAVVKSGTWSGTDTLSNFETITGSDAYADAFTATGTGNYTLRGSTGADVITDTITYAGLSAINATLGASVTVVKSGGTDTLSSIETITGTSNNDTFNSGTGTFTLSGGAGGIDTLRYDTTSNAMTIALSATVAQSGTTTKSGSWSGTDTFTGIDAIVGSTGNDAFTAGTGTYTLNGASGTDSLTYAAAGGALTLNLQTGAVVKSGSWSGTDTIYNFETITGSDNYADAFTASESGDYTLNGGAGAFTDTITYGALNWYVDVTLGSTVTVYKPDYGSTDTLTSIESITGTSFDDLFYAGTGTFTLNGNGGSDYLSYESTSNAMTIALSTTTAGSGTTTKSGTWSGTDTFSGMYFVLGSTGNDVFTAGRGSYELYGQGGTDSLTYAAASGAVTINLQVSSVIKTGTWSGTDWIFNFETITGSDAYADAFTGTNGGNYTLRGSTGADAITDTITYAGLAAITATLGASVTVVKSVGTDTLSSIESITGTSNNDTFNSGTGSFTLTGSGGTDTLSYSSTSNAMTIALSSTTAGSGTTTKSGTWSGTDTFATMDTIVGSSGNDSFTAGRGTLTLNGGAGTDSLTYAAAGGALTINLQTGSVNKNAWVAGTSDTISNFETITGSDNYADAFTAATTGNYTLNGGSGAFTDSITYAGMSLLITVNLGSTVSVYKEVGLADTLSSIEDITGTSFGDTFNAGTGTFALHGGSGTDTLDYSAGGTLSVSLSASTANSGTATKSGTWSGTDTFDGFETITGTVNNDSFTAGTGTYTLNGNTGTDTLTYVNAAAAVAVNLTTNTVTKTTAGAWTGTDTISNFETITGGGSGDTFTVGSGTYTLDGGGSTDMLSYASAADTVTVNLQTGSAVKSGAWSGTDTLSNFENVTGGTGNDTITGNTSGNYIYGGAGNDTIDGGGGTDYLYGEAGDDTITTTYFADGGADNDTITGSGASSLYIVLGTGNDIYFGASTTGGGSVDTGSGTDQVYGGSGDEYIADSTGDDWYAGGTNATVSGDVLDYSSRADAGFLGLTLDLSVTSYTGPQGDGGYARVTLNGLGEYDYVKEVETFALSGKSDSFYGDAGDNIVGGGAGDDTFVGRGGNDYFDGEGGNDVVDYSSVYYTNGIQITLGAGFMTIADNGGATVGTDTIYGTERVVGSNSADIFRGLDSVNDTFDGKSGNDTFYVNGGANALIGGGGTDTANYSGASLAVTGSLTGASLQGGFTTQYGSTSVSDTTFTIENYILTGSNDNITFDYDALSALYTSSGSVNFGSGTDTSAAQAGTDINLADGSVLGAIFTNLEEIDFRSTTDGGTSFDINWTDVQNITGSATGTLTLHVDTGFRINVAGGGVDTWAADNTYTSGGLTLIVDVA